MHASFPPYTKQQPTGAYRSTSVERVRVLPLVNADLHKRVAKGAGEYGEPLTTHNGRDALWDAYEEALDLCMYLRQAIEERNQPTSCKGQNQPTSCAPERIAKVAAGNPPTVPGYPIEGVPPERIPKWDPAWGKPPNCDGHPMQAEAIRDHDERLSGAEDRL
ncbi:hypothetical protein ACFWZU_15615 [Frateuria sp. GZRR33]|uniref:hypothetical protein n=1 Tax=Frateuria sp. GZRR33 TaxID=3351535 RepID=UPI003EDC6A3D